jgi:hypothetical protein
MARQAPGPHRDEVEAQRVPGEVGAAQQEQLGRARGALPLLQAQRDQSLLEVATRLDLDEGDQTAAPGDQIDLAERRAKAPGDDAIAAQAQASRGHAFRPAAPGLAPDAAHRPCSASARR